MVHDWPKELTVEQARALASIVADEIIVPVRSEIVLSKDGQRTEAKVFSVKISNEKDLTPELIVQGPKARGDVNCYVLADGKTAVFEAKTGALIGREFRIRSAPEANGRTNTVVMASRTSKEVNRQYIR